MNRVTPQNVETLLSAIFGVLKTREFTSGSLLKRARTDAPEIMAAIEAILGRRRLHAIRLGRLLESLREGHHGDWHLDGVRDGHKNTWTYHVEPVGGLPVEVFESSLQRARLVRIEEESRLEDEMDECATLAQQAKILDRELRRAGREERRAAKEEVRAELAQVARDTRERRQQEAREVRLEQDAELAATPVVVRLVQRWATRELAEEAGRRLGPEAVVEISRDADRPGSHVGGSQVRFGIRLELNRATAPRRHAELAKVALHFGWRLDPLADPAPPIDPRPAVDVLPPGAFPNARIGEAIQLQQAPTPHESI